MKLSYVSAVACLFWSLSAYSASFFSGNQLLQMMKGDALERATAMGFVAGVHDGQDLVSTSVGNKVPIVCAPTGVTLKQINDVAQKYLEQKPESRHYTASSEIGLALMTAWPCKK